MKKASIIGLGNILKGYHGIGCYILEAFAQERLGESVHLAYLGDDPRYAAGLLYETVRKAIWEAVRIIKKNLSERGFLPEGAVEISPIYRIELPDTAV